MKCSYFNPLESLNWGTMLRRSGVEELKYENIIELKAFWSQLHENIKSLMGII